MSFDEVINAMENEFGYFSKDVAKKFDITTSTLRRWAIALEKKGYLFERNDKNQRIFYKHDYDALTKLKELLNNSVPFENAIEVVVSTIQNDSEEPKTPSVYNNSVRLSKGELREMIKELLEEERENILNALDYKLSNQIELRDRYLMQEWSAALEEKQKKKKIHWWQKIFGSPKIEE